MPVEITTGWLQGRHIRRARKAFRCDYNHGVSNGGRCPRVIRPGELYAEGELDPYKAGGFGFERYCLMCAGDEAQEAARPLLAA